MAAAAVFVTGVPELDYMLAQLEPKAIRPAVVKATDATIRYHVVPAYRDNIVAAGFVETGATRDVARKRRVKRSRLQFGSELWLDRRKVVEVRLARGGRIGFDKKRDEDFFHPIAIEFGTDRTRPERPMYDALMGNVPQALAEFHKYLRAVLTGVKLGGFNYDRRFKV